MIKGSTKSFQILTVHEFFPCFVKEVEEFESVSWCLICRELMVVLGMVVIANWNTKKMFTIHPCSNNFGVICCFHYIVSFNMFSRICLSTSPLLHRDFAPINLELMFLALHMLKKFSLTNFPPLSPRNFSGRRYILILIHKQYLLVVLLHSLFCGVT